MICMYALWMQLRLNSMTKCKNFSSYSSSLFPSAISCRSRSGVSSEFNQWGMWLSDCLDLVRCPVLWYVLSYTLSKLSCILMSLLHTKIFYFAHACSVTLCAPVNMCSVHDHEPSVYIHVQARAKAHSQFCFLFLCRPELEIIRLGIIK